MLPVSLLVSRNFKVKACFNFHTSVTPLYELPLFWGIHIPRCERVSKQYSYVLKLYEVFVELKKQNNCLGCESDLCFPSKFSWDFSFIHMQAWKVESMLWPVLVQTVCGPGSVVGVHLFSWPETQNFSL